MYGVSLVSGEWNARGKKTPTNPLGEKKSKKKPAADPRNPPVNCSAEPGSPLALQADTPRRSPRRQQARGSRLCCSCPRCLRQQRSRQRGLRFCPLTLSPSPPRTGFLQSPPEQGNFFHPGSV